MAPTLSPEEVVTLQVLKRKGQSNTQIAQTLGTTEGAVRYQVRRHGTPDGRQNKPRKADPLAEAIDGWASRNHPATDGDGPGRPRQRPGPVRSAARRARLRRLVQVGAALRPRPLPPAAAAPLPPRRDTAGAQAQVDWGTFTGIDLGDGPQTLYAFVLVLSYSRKEALIWCRCLDQLAWHHAPTEAFRRLGGVPAALRIDNLKTGVAQGADPWGQGNGAFRSYARALGFHVAACLPRCPEDKGTVESKVGHLKRRLRLGGSPFAGLADLQAWTDGQLDVPAVAALLPAQVTAVQPGPAVEGQFLRHFLPPEPGVGVLFRMAL
jgi:hypothetical protein